MQIALLFAFVAVIYAQSCPAGTCPSGETCCNIGGGQWGCCPYPNADCCTDDAHCCPNGYQCDLSKGQCVQQLAHNAHIHGQSKQQTRPLGVMAHLDVDVEEQQSCPAGTCPSGETCCNIGGGQWGCCPYPNADCCTDDAHCCPNGYQCDLSKGQCVQQASFNNKIGNGHVRGSKLALAKLH